MAPSVRALLAGKIEFNRPPRIRSGLSRTLVEVPTAPPTPHKPGSSLATGLVIPIVTVMAMSGVFLVASGSGDPGQRGIMLVAGAGLLVGSALAPAWAFFEDRRRFRRQIVRQQDEFGRRLRNLEPELTALREEEYALRLADDPAPAVLVERALARDRRLWERRPRDDDFLAIRLGLGPAPSLLDVAHREDSEPQAEEPGPRLAQLMTLKRQAAQLAVRHRHIPDVPIRADLKTIGALGVVGARRQTDSVARALLCQAAGLHSPDDLQIVAVLGEDSIADWTWLKWLPHVRPSRVGDAPPLLAWNAAGRAELSRWLLDELTGRQRVLSEVNPYDVARVNLSWLLVFVDDVSALRADPALKLALADGKKLRVATICTTDDQGLVPGGCGGVALLDPRPDGLLSYVLSADGSPTTAEPTQCLPDMVAPAEAEALARALAPIVVAQDTTRDQGLDIPARISFFEALDVASVDRLDVAESWKLGEPSSLLRVPLGPKAGGELLTLDLKEQGQGGHGPHGLVAGTTGAGKSELLLTMIAGLALRHPPDVLTFVLIDYKGGEAFKAVADLPHTVALITDLDRHLAQRALETDPLPGRLMAPMSQHPYLYAQANPTSLIDPSGLAASLSWPGLGAPWGDVNLTPWVSWLWPPDWRHDPLAAADTIAGFLSTAKVEKLDKLTAALQAQADAAFQNGLRYANDANDLWDIGNTPSSRFLLRLPVVRDLRTMWYARKAQAPLDMAESFFTRSQSLEAEATAVENSFQVVRRADKALPWVGAAVDAGFAGFDQWNQDSEKNVGLDTKVTDTATTAVYTAAWSWGLGALAGAGCAATGIGAIVAAGCAALGGYVGGRIAGATSQFVDEWANTARVEITQGAQWAGNELGQGASWAGNEVSQGADWAKKHLCPWC